LKVVILAGGKGTRGKPFTDYFPKAMIPVCGKPLIEYLVRYLSSFDFIDEIIIIADLNKFGGQIQNYFKDRKTHKNLTFIQDSQAGTAGDLIHLSKKLEGTPNFILWFADNLAAIKLDMMYKFYKQTKSFACVATRKYRREETGFALVKNGMITEFKEKPIIEMPISECLGVYVLATKILAKIRSKLKAKKKNLNFSFDILQELSSKEKISAFDIGKTSWVDVESPITLERNKKLITKIVKEMKV